MAVMVAPGVQLLLIEDDVSLASAICDGVRGQGGSVERAVDASAARIALLDHVFAAVVFDIGSSWRSGLAILKWLRARRDSTPVLLLAEQSAASERIQALDSGADDYLIKPFDLNELLARIRAVVRRSRGNVVADLRCGDVQVDPERRIVTRAGERISLSSHEYRTLLALIERPGRVVTRGHLEQVVYGSGGTLGSNTIAVFIHQLRRKLGESIIATVHGHGYMLGH
jgi:two-component system OmpR family response regulator